MPSMTSMAFALRRVRRRPWASADRRQQNFGINTAAAPRTARAQLTPTDIRWWRVHLRFNTLRRVSIDNPSMRVILFPALSGHTVW